MLICGGRFRAQANSEGAVRPVSAEAVDSVLMPGSSFGTTSDVCIHHHRRKIKGARRSKPNLASPLPPRIQAVDGKWPPQEGLD